MGGSLLRWASILEDHPAQQLALCIEVVRKAKSLSLSTYGFRPIVSRFR